MPSHPPNRVAVINVVGLSRSLLEHAPRLGAHGAVRRLQPTFPAVTCSVQSSMLTGRGVGGDTGHGIVGNGWFNDQQQEVQFWKQSNKLVRGEKVWEAARRRNPTVTCANMFWWFNMYCSADVSVTVRPTYKADGRKIPDCYAQPAELRDQLQARPPQGLGRFPLFNFWGPMANLASSQWIAQASKRVHRAYDPTLMLVYLPHLDYGLQKLGPEHPKIAHHVAEIDAVAGDLIDDLMERDVTVLIVSEYGIEPVSNAKSSSVREDGAVFINRMLREQGLLRVRIEDGLELLDSGASAAFAVVDHQAAHLHVKSHGPGPTAHPEHVESLCREVDGVGDVVNLNDPRGGDFTLIAQPGRWFTYDYWLDQANAPDFARTVDIHRKPGYDPRELFIDAARSFPKSALAWKLLRKKLGFRQLMDIIPLDTSLVRGTHGRTDMPDDLQPLLIAPDSLSPSESEIPCTAVHDLILRAMFDEASSSHTA